MKKDIPTTPYRSVVFDETSLDPNARVILDGEKRPSTRDSQSAFLSLTQAGAAPERQRRRVLSILSRFIRDHRQYARRCVVSEGRAVGRRLALVSLLPPGAPTFTASSFPAIPRAIRRTCPDIIPADYRLLFHGDLHAAALRPM